MRDRNIHHNKFPKWGVLPETCMLSCEKPYISFTRPKNLNIWLREDPNECPGKLESIERRDLYMATDFKELCKVKYILFNVRIHMYRVFNFYGSYSLHTEIL